MATPNTSAATRIAYVLNEQVQAADMLSEQAANRSQIGRALLASQGVLNALPASGPDAQPLQIATDGTFNISLGGNFETVYCQGYLCDACPAQLFVVPAPGAGTRVDLIAIAATAAQSTGATIPRQVFTAGVGVVQNIGLATDGIVYQYVQGTVGAGVPAVPVGYVGFATVTVGAGVAGIFPENITYLFAQLTPQGAPGAAAAPGSAGAFCRKKFAYGTRYTGPIPASGSSEVATTQPTRTASVTVSCRAILHQPDIHAPDTWYTTYLCSKSAESDASWSVNAEIAPHNAGTQLKFHANSITGNADAADLKLYNPAGALVLTALRIVAGTDYTYSDAHAITGTYIWKISPNVGSKVPGGGVDDSSGVYVATVTPQTTVAQASSGTDLTQVPAPLGYIELIGVQAGAGNTMEACFALTVAAGAGAQIVGGALLSNADESWVSVDGAQVAGSPFSGSGLHRWTATIPDDNAAHIVILHTDNTTATELHTEFGAWLPADDTGAVDLSKFSAVVPSPT